MNIQFPLTVFYDHSCLACRSEMLNLKSRDRGDVLQLVDASVLSNLQLHGVEKSQQELMQLLHARDAAGQWLIGVDVFEQIYAVTDLAWVAAALSMPLVHGVAQRLYPTVARYRYALPNRLIQWGFNRAYARARRQAALAEAHWQAERCQEDGVCRHTPESASKAAPPLQVSQNNAAPRSAHVDP